MKKNQQKIINGLLFIIIIQYLILRSSIILNPYIIFYIHYIHMMTIYIYKKNFKLYTMHNEKEKWKSKIYNNQQQKEESKITNVNVHTFKLFIHFLCILNKKKEKRQKINLKLNSHTKIFTFNTHSIKNKMEKKNLKRLKKTANKFKGTLEFRAHRLFLNDKKRKNFKIIKNENKKT